MIESISTWAEQIIVAVIVATIIEMILPNGNNKKYIKAVIGVYILFTIISPILKNKGKLNFDNIDYEKYFENSDTYQTMSESLTNKNDQSIEEIYESNLKQDITAKLKEKGYRVESVELRINFEENNYGKINEIDLTVFKIGQEEIKSEESKVNIGTIERINIGNEILENNTNEKNEDQKIEKLSSNEKKEIKAYISSVYEINQKNIIVNKDT